MAYKNAFKCHKCPETNNSNGCPCWIEIIFENDTTGDKRTEKGCYFQLAPQIMVQLIKATNQTTEESSKLNNNLLNGLCDVGNIMMQELHNNAQISENNSEVPAQKK